MATRKAHSNMLADIITRSFKGEEPLWLVFWVYGYMILGLVWIVFLESIKPYMETWEQVLSGTPGLLQTGLTAYVVLDLVLFFTFIGLTFGWYIISIWRCAANSKKFWFVLARIYCVIAVLGLVATAAASFIEKA